MGKKNASSVKNKNSQMRVFWRTFFSRGIIVKISLAVAIIFVLISLLADPINKFLLHQDPLAVDLMNLFADPSSEHLLGTDLYGRDILARIVSGAQMSLICSVFSCLLGAVIGIILGLIAGYFEGVIGTIIMRYVDIQMSIPSLIFIIVISLITGESLFGVIMALAFGLIPNFVRVMYSLVLQLKGSDYVTAAKLIGVSEAKIMMKHILPNTFPSMIVMFTMSLGSNIMLESTLSFLSIGIKVPTPSWGNMISEGYSYIIRGELMLSFAPGVCLMLVVIAFNILGDALRDSLDPRLRGKI